MGAAQVMGAGLGAVAGMFVGNPVLGAAAGAALGGTLLGAGPEQPKSVQQPDPSDEAVRNARLMERRKQLGLQGRMSTFLTTAQGEGPSTSQPSAAPPPTSTLLGG